MGWISGALLAGALIAIPARAAQPWRQASSAHFVIYSQDSAANLRQFAERLERFDKALRLLQALDDAPLGDANRLTVYVVENSAAVQRLMGDSNSGVAGFYRGRAGSSIAVTSRERGDTRFGLNPQIVLLHEYAHHFMLRNFPAAYPGWYREGFAEFYATTRFEPDGSLFIGVPANHRVVELALAEFDVTRLLVDAAGRQRASSMEIYGYGWLLTHYLNFSQARRGQLTAYLNAINEGVPTRKAAEAAFGDLGKLQRELRTYLSQRRMMTMKLTADRLPTGAIVLRDLGAGEQAIMPTVIRSRLGVDEKSAGKVAVAARRAAAPFPNDPAVQVALAEAEYDAGALDAAEAAAERALAADPRSLRALDYKAMVKLARAAKAEGAAKTALVKAARADIVRANRLDPDNPEPLILFYSSYAALDAEPTANAATGLLTAHRLAAEDDSLRLLTAMQLIRDERPKEARILLAPLAFSPHGGGPAEAAQALLAKLPRGPDAPAPGTAPTKPEPAIPARDAAAPPPSPR